MKSGHKSRVLLTALVATGLATAGQVAAGGGAGAAPPSTAGTTRAVIVVLRDQLPSVPATREHLSARKSKATSAQQAVLSRLPGSRPSHLKQFSVGNAFSATVTQAQADALAADPSVAAVVPDAQIAVTPQATPAAAAGGTAKSSAPAAPSADGPFAICPSDPSKPLLEPEALTSIHAASTDGSPSAQDLASGAGVKVAYIADGIDPDNPDFIRPNGDHVIVDYQDFSGDGPNAPSGGAEAFGDASSIAAQGTVTHDLSQFVNQAHPLPPGCNIRVVGVAPGASIVALKAGGEFLANSSILQSIDYAVNVAHVDVINESFGLNQYPDSSSRNTIQLFNDAAVAAGVTITTSTGDAGITSTIGSPATDPKVISAAATTDNRLYAQTTYAAFPFSNGKWISDNISALSSSGLTQGGRTVDVTAPGEGNWSVCEPGFLNCFNFRSPPQPTDLQSFGGTSESAPLTAGVAALVIQAYRGTHGGASPSPALVKKLITSTTTDLGLPADEQGSGLLNARAAVEAALTYPGSSSAPAGVKSNIALSTDQLTLEGAPGSSQSATVKVTNVGTKPLTVSASTRDFAPLSSATQSTTFDSTTLPTFTYYNGAQWAFKEVRFSVPSGAQRLLTRMAWNGQTNAAGVTPVVRLSLLAPDGTFVANSRPQGGPASANYANVDVRNPAAGTWTAVLYSAAGPTGYTGPIRLGIDTQRTVPFGQVSPAVFGLAVGQTKSVHVTFTTPSSGGDADYSIQFGSSDGHQTTVSAILRSLVPTRSGTGHFSGTITGGNARGVSPAQTFTYAFDVPKGKDDLDVSLVLSKDAGDLVAGVLIDPNGELSDVTSNSALDPSFNQVQGKGLQLFSANPLAGRWQFVVVVQNPVTGNDLSQTFDGTVTFDKVRVDAPSLPNSPSVKLPKGQPTTVNVRVHNTGVEPLAVGVDARTSKVQTLQAVPIQGSATFDLPPDPAQEPIYLTPPNTSKLTVAANSTTPAQLELQGSAAGFDLFGDLAQAQQGNSLSVASVSENKGYISKGIWFTNMQQIGPFTDAGAPAGSSTLSASMKTLGFDSAVTSSTDDPFLGSIDPTAGLGSPAIIAPGATATIQVVVTPTGNKGSKVDGLLNIVTLPLLSTTTANGGLPQVTTGSVIAALPYRYTVG